MHTLALQFSECYIKISKTKDTFNRSFTLYFLIIINICVIKENFVLLLFVICYNTNIRVGIKSWYEKGVKSLILFKTLLDDF